MKAKEINFDVSVESEKALKQIEKTNQAIKKLKKELYKLQFIEIEFKIIDSEPKWWQFWK